jgi:hypothetical protein
VYVDLIRIEKIHEGIQNSICIITTLRIDMFTSAEPLLRKQLEEEFYTS